MDEHPLDQVASLEAKQQEIHERIRNLAEQKGFIEKGLYPVLDGVADIKGYLSSSPKIMWILKGAYPSKEENSEYQIWDCWNEKEHNLASWTPLINILHAIRHRIDMGERIELREMKSIDQSQIDDFKKTAYINICKVPYDHTHDDLKEQSKVWREIVKEQINLYKPDIIFFGGTYDILKDQDDFLNNILIDKTPTQEIAHIYRNPEGTILFNAWHPAYPGAYRKDLLDYYVDEIADVIYKHTSQRVE